MDNIAKQKQIVWHEFLVAKAIFDPAQVIISIFVIAIAHTETLPQRGT